MSLFESHVLLFSTVVVKKLHAIRLERIQLEVKIMEALCGGPNIIQLLDIYCNDPSSPSKTTRFVYEYIPNRYYKYQVTDPPTC